MRHFLLFLVVLYGCSPKVATKQTYSKKGELLTRYYYIMLRSSAVYEEPDENSKQFSPLEAGDTISTLRVPIELKGWQAVEKNDFLYYIKEPSLYAIQQKTFRAEPGYRPLYRATAALATYKPATIPPPLVEQWYGRLGESVALFDKPNAMSKSSYRVGKGAIAKIKRHDVNYWHIEVDGHVGYVGAFYIDSFSATENPFINTKYTGPTFKEDYEATNATTRTYTGGYYRPSARYSTPTTGARIHTGPRGGKFYYNSKGNKTYIKRK